MEFEKLVAIISEFTNIDEDKITKETKFVDDLNVDSLDLVQIIMAVEEEFDIEIDNEQAEKIVTVNDAVEAINSEINND
ncbi:acyl carrier protein [Vallitalea pronyensis]|uniref:Acyl carrier protein n=1 Tax=Vallitalea pronyensis TaxID=1348613 RepID=A0A8J8SH29_9FIRM|nr:acyl carrier protein [Vallitalea pronyensis]QUI22948.1 acyl carrier protein [Vallitalea pronyensis]